MEIGENNSGRITSSEMVLSTVAGILYGVGIALLIAFTVLTLFDPEMLSSITNILFG